MIAPVRHILRALPPLALLLSLGIHPAAAQEQSAESFDLAAARYAAAHRTRRIVVNNDGNDCIDLPDADVEHSPTEMLARRTTPLLGTHVDSIFYCDGVFDSYTHQSEESELRREVSGGRRSWAEELFEEHGKDPLTVMLEFGQEHDIEVFWSMRMNDTHDSSPQWSMMFAAWKRDHPDLLMGTPEAPPPFGGKRWSAVDYSHAEVRDKVFRILQDVVSRYDVDGIELDFFRHPVYFAAAARGEPVPQEQQDAMTDLLRRVRTMVDATATTRKKPILIAARLPDSVDFCRAMGLDLEAWLEQDLLDLLVGSGYVHLRPWEDWAALGKRHDVPAYACLSGSRLVSPSAPEAGEDLELWRGEALRAWDAGVAGIYTFNRFKPESALFRELGDPELLRTLPRRDEFVPGTTSHLRRWVKGGERYLVVPEWADGK